MIILGVFHDTWNIAVDAAPWQLLGLLAAGLIKAFVPDKLLARWLGGRGCGPVIRTAFVGAPLPLCFCGVLPTALSLHRQGASKDATVSFLVMMVAVGAVTFGLLTDLLVDTLGIDIHAQASHGQELIPHWLAICSLAVLIVLAIRPLRRKLLSCQPQPIS